MPTKSGSGRASGSANSRVRQPAADFHANPGEGDLKNNASNLKYFKQAQTKSLFASLKCGFFSCGISMKLSCTSTIGDQWHSHGFCACYSLDASGSCIRIKWGTQCTGTVSPVRERWQPLAGGCIKIGLGARVGGENGEDEDDNHGDKWKNDQKADVDEEADTELISESFCDSDMSRP